MINEDGFAVEHGIFEDNCANHAPFQYKLNDGVISDSVNFDALMATWGTYIDFFTGRFEIHDGVGYSSRPLDDITITAFTTMQFIIAKPCFQSSFVKQ